MNTLRTSAAVLLLLLGAIALPAQAVTGTGPAPSLPTVTVQMGYDLGYNVKNAKVGSSFDMSLLLTLTDSLQAGVTFLNGDGSQFAGYQLLDLYYSFLPRVGTLLSIGSETAAGTAVAGLGVYSNVIGRNAGGVQTGLRLLVDYLAPLGSGFTSGTFRLGIVAWVGV